MYKELEIENSVSIRNAYRFVFIAYRFHSLSLYALFENGAM